MADAKYHVESKTVELLLGPDSVSFKVPEFQRSYAWGVDEVTQLLDDLFDESHWSGDTSNIDIPYFLGSLVLAKKDDENLILDGQQRLATVSLLLTALEMKLKEAGYSDASKIRQYLEAGRIGERKSPKLKLQPTDSGLYGMLLKDPNQYKTPGNKQRSLAHAMKTISTRLNAYAAEGAKNGIAPLKLYEKMVSTLLYGVEFVTILSPSESDAFKLFETLNDRGLALNAADLIKNKLFAQCGGVDIDDAIEAWKNTIETVGEKEIVNFLRYFWMASEGFVRKRGLYDVFRKHLENMKGSESALFALKIEEYAQVYQHIADPNPKTSLWGEEAGEALQRLDNYNARSCRSALLACAADKKRSNDEMVRLIAVCESITIRYSTVGEKNPNQLETMYAQLCTALRENSGSIQSILSTDTIFELPNDTEFHYLFIGVELSTVTPTWREILVRLNSVLGTGETKVEGTRKVHVEHVLPQKPSAKSLHEASLTQLEAEELIGKIGNLTLLSGKTNREGSNKPFSAKKESYVTSEIALNRWIAKKDRWGQDEIEERSQELARLAVKAYPWPIP